MWGEKWQQLESITHLMLSSDFKVLKKGSEVPMKGAEKTIQQKEIGDKPNIDEYWVTLVILARKHNVIDSILYDRRREPNKVYFVQTSSLAYSRKRKRYRMLAPRPSEERFY